MSSRPARHLVEWACERGVEEAAVMEALGLEGGERGGADDRLPVSRFLDALEFVVRELGGGEAPVGLTMTEGWGVELFGVIGYLIYTSATLEVALARVIEFKGLWSDAEEMWCEESRGVASVCWRVLGPERPAHRVLADMALSDLVGGTQRLMGRALPLHEIWLPFEAPKDPAPYEEIAAGASLRFDAPWMRVAMDAAAMRWPMPAGDEILHAYFVAQAASRHHLHAESSVSERARSHLWRALVGGAPSVAEVARSMGMSSRTLQRHLRSDGVTYAGLLDRVRHALALEHLESEVSVAELSWLLGFSEPRALHRAFKRWTGTTPALTRERVKAERGRGG